MSYRVDIDYYEILQVSPNASSEVIDAAYRRLARVYHPDVGGSNEAMALLNEAYRVLSDPRLRCEYDRARAFRTSSNFASPQASSRQREEDGSSGNSSGFTFSSPHETGVVVRPWVRYWARCIDYACWMIVLGVVTALFSLDWIWTEVSDLLLGVIATALWIPVEALLLSRWGTTPGKALLCVRVSTLTETKPAFREAFRRAFMVWWRGLGAGFPVVTLITMVLEYSRLVHTYRTTWDASLGFKVTHERIGAARGIVAGLLLLALGVLAAIGNNYQKPQSEAPPSTIQSFQQPQAVQEQERESFSLLPAAQPFQQPLQPKEEKGTSAPSNAKFITPTKLEAIKAFNAAIRLYDDSYGFVPDDVARKRMIESIKRIIESFPANWKCGLLVVRYVDASGNFGCGYYPLIETQDGYYYGEYYLKGVEIREVRYENIYRGFLSPVSMAEKEPIAIWRSSSLWRNSKIWDTNYWRHHGQYGDPDLPGAEWLPLN